MRFQQAPYRIADVVALLFILHGNTSFGSLAPIIPYRSCKHYLEVKKKDVLTPKKRKPRKSKAEQIKLLVRQAQKSGMNLDEIADKLGMALPE